MQESFHIEASRRRCQTCGREFQPTEEYVAGVLDVEADDSHPHGLARHDYCPEHWTGDHQPYLAFWRTRVPVPQEPAKRRLVIDDDRLLEVFFRLAQTNDPLKLDLRYVIGLMLLRKRRLKLEGSRTRGGEKFMRVRKSRTRELHDLLDRKLSDAAVIGVSQEIGTLLDLVDAPTALEEEPADESS